jgi:hypothetical protein
MIYTHNKPSLIDYDNGNISNLPICKIFTVQKDLPEYENNTKIVEIKVIWANFIAIPKKKQRVTR